MPPKQPPPRSVRLKVLVAGPHKAGKSCLIKNFCEGRFVKRYLPTIGIDYGVREVKIQDTAVKINFFDASGLPEFAEIRSEFYGDVQALVFVYDVSDKTAFAQLSDLIAEVSDPAKACCFLVGTKTDLGQKVGEAEERVVLNRLGCRLFKLSAQTGEGVQSFFDTCFAETFAKFYGQ
ncbi:RabB [Spironucleus salmonicida]|uniref:RabB n=1 Tax=Spironucleus salmonicida TaxID=348837 RepID=V6LI43_9EUKA|nr:RabB [Spironucleus salmonicida]|eukprot:EST43381.1 RabB [Spironucleus salmonicida]